MLHAGISAIGTDGAFVGYCLTEINAGILEAIYAGKNLRPDHAPEWLVSRICAAIVDVPRDNRSNHAVSFQRNPGVPKSSFFFLRARGHVPGAGFHPPYRVSSCFFRTPCTDCP